MRVTRPPLLEGWRTGDAGNGPGDAVPPKAGPVTYAGLGPLPESQSVKYIHGIDATATNGAETRLVHGRVAWTAAPGL